jgi:hypothetical protein
MVVSTRTRPGAPGRPGAASRDDPAHPDAAYRERARLVACLAAVHGAHWAEPDPDDPHADAYRVVCLHTAAGQMTWHVHPDDEALFGPLPTRPSDFDGHTTAVKHARLARLAARPPRRRPGASGRDDARARERALRLLDEARREHDRADVKAGSLLGVASTAVAVVGAAVLAGDWSPAALPAAGRVLWWAGCVAGAAGVALLAVAVTPGRIRGGGSDAIAWFGDVPAVAARGTAALALALWAGPMAELGGLAGQLAVCAAIAVRKYRLIRAGVAALAGAGALLTLAAIFGGLS